MGTRPATCRDLWTVLRRVGRKSMRALAFSEGVFGPMPVPSSIVQRVCCWGLQHVGQPKATSRLSWESVEAGSGSHQEKGEPRPPTARARVAPLYRRCAANRDGCGESLSVTWTTLRQARSRTALLVGGLGPFFPLLERRCPCVRLVGFKSLFFAVLVRTAVPSSACGFCAQRLVP